MNEQTKSNITEVASDAADKGRQVTQDASEGAQWVAATAREQAGNVGQELSAQGQRIVGDVKEKLHEQGERQSADLATSLRGWAAETKALAEGRPEEAGPLADYAQRAAGKVSEVADRIEERGVEGGLDDVKAFARRRPGVFLLGAGIAGFAVGRLLRSASSASDQSSSAPAVARANPEALPAAETSEARAPAGAPR